MDVDKWQNRLKSTFTQNGIVGWYLLDVLKAEDEYQSKVISTYVGYDIL